MQALNGILRKTLKRHKPTGVHQRLHIWKDRRTNVPGYSASSLVSWNNTALCPADMHHIVCEVQPNCLLMYDHTAALDPAPKQTNPGYTLARRPGVGMSHSVAEPNSFDNVATATLDERRLPIWEAQPVWHVDVSCRYIGASENSAYATY
eukprot:354060-Chlamydomonas_euryale.AAC.10